MSKKEFGNVVKPIFQRTFFKDSVVIIFCLLDVSDAGFAVIFTHCMKDKKEELYILYTQPTGMIKLGMMRWAGNVACVGERGIMLSEFWFRKPEEKIYFG